MTHLYKDTDIYFTNKCLGSFFKGGRGGRVYDLSDERVEQFGSLITNGELFDISLIER